MSKALILICLVLLLFLPASARIEMSGGWAISSEGQASSSGQSYASSVSGDPSITLGIVSASNVYGPDADINLLREGSISDSLSLGGFGLSASFDGDVQSQVILTSAGTASAASFVGVTATGLPTGFGSYEIFGTADINTEGFLHGEGSATASASGSSSYGVTREGTASEVWGQAQGSSSTSLVGSSPDSYASTGGKKNGIHAESSVLYNRRGEVSDSSVDTVSAYASALNSARATATVSGEAQSGGWDPSTTGTKIRKVNEITTATASGTLTAEASAPGFRDVADVSAIVEAVATRNTVQYAGLQKGLYVSGGPSTYASSVLSSSADEANAQAKIKDALWGSLARQTGSTALEWGKIDAVECGAISRESGAFASSFAKILMSSDLMVIGAVTSSAGNMTIATSTEVSQDKKALAGAIVYGLGQGDTWTDDGYMQNSAGYIGDTSELVHHYSFTSSEEAKGEIITFAKNAWVSTEPGGKAIIGKPYGIDNTVNPMYAWSSTEGWYYQAR